MVSDYFDVNEISFRIRKQFETKVKSLTLKLSKLRKIWEFCNVICLTDHTPTFGDQTQVDTSKMYKRNPSEQNHRS